MTEIENQNILDLESMIKNIKYNFNDNYGITYISDSSFKFASNAVYRLLELGGLSNREFDAIISILHQYKENEARIRTLDLIQPRYIAQKFIGKRNVRNFIFSRDKGCLKCGRVDSLTIDHIIPIAKGCENKLFNLQTLCKRCNCSKSDKYKDYRNGAR